MPPMNIGRAAGSGVAANDASNVVSLFNAELSTSTPLEVENILDNPKKFAGPLSGPIAWSRAYDANVGENVSSISLKNAEPEMVPVIPAAPPPARSENTKTGSVNVAVPKPVIFIFE